MYVPLLFVIPLKMGVQFRLFRFKERETVDKIEVTYSMIYLASPQTSFGVHLSRIHFYECVTNEPQRTSAGRL